jgi:hypothetical protein
MGEHPALTNSRLWSVRYSHNNDRMLLDPINRSPFNPNEVPQCIEEDSLLYAGLKSLFERGPAIHMETAYTPHTTEDSLSFGWRGRGFERSVRRADYFGFEAFGYSIEGPEYYNRVKDSWRWREESGKAQPIIHRGVDLTGYANRRRRVIATCGSPVKCFPMDVAGINSSPLERKIIEAQEVFFDGYWSFETYAALCGIRNVREWIMLARLGIALQEREGDKSRRLRIFNQFGRQHQDVTRKAQLLGMYCKSIVKDQDDDLRQETRMMETGIVPYDHYVKFSKTTDNAEGG